MTRSESVMPLVLTKLTLVFEFIAFLTSHLVDSRGDASLHEGLFVRCTHPSRFGLGNYTCFWWSADTFGRDSGSLQFVTVLAFVSLIVLGLSVLYSWLAWYYNKLETRHYKVAMATVNGLNAIMLLLFVIVYTFGYAGDTKIIPGDAPLMFSWSYYFLFAGLATNILATIFFMYSPWRGFDKVRER
jgi:hypothetical protein